MVFPASARIYNHMSIKVPVDDTHTLRFLIFADLLGDESTHETVNGSRHKAVVYQEEGEAGKDRLDAVHPLARYRMDRLPFQDMMVLETQGPIAARENERLATADQGLVLLRNLLEREIKKVQQGLDPIGVIRDPDHELIDTYIQIYLENAQRFPQERHRTQAR
jgi:5,5'-dehydrodivanillate O-demethylase